MPMAKMIRTPVSSKYRELEDDLVQEWLHPRSEAVEPVIIEDDEDGDGESLRLYVIWSRWAGLDEIERSEVIASAGEQVRGRGFVLTVTSASGLTPEEADHMGFKYVPLASAA